MTPDADPAHRPPRLPRLGTRGFQYLAGEAGAKGLTYLFLILLAARTSPAAFGYLNLFIAMSGLAAVAVGLGLPEAAFRFHFRRESYPAVLGACLAGVLAAAAVVALAVLPAAGRLAAALAVPRELVVVGLATAPAIALRQLWLAVLKARQDSRRFAVARIAEPLAMILLLVPFLLRPGLVPYGPVLLAYGGAAALVAAWGVARLARDPGLAWTARPLPELLRYSLPLVFHAAAMTGLASFDQIVVNQLLGAEATGAYAYAYRFAMAMSLVGFAVAAVWSPLVLAPRAEERAADLARLARRIVDLCLGLTVALCLLLPPVARVIGGGAYAGALGIIPWIVYGYLWSVLYFLLVAYLIRRDRTRTVALASGAAFVFNLAANYLTIPRFGPVAAAWTTVASYALLTLLVRAGLGRDLPLPTRGLLLRVVALAPLVLWIARLF